MFIQFGFLNVIISVSVDNGIPVVSLINLDSCILSLNMPNLEKIDIRQTSQSNVSDEGGARRPCWPSLKVLNMNVDLKSAFYPELDELHLLFDVCFGNFVRPQLTELTLNFESKLRVLAPMTEDIANSCPNLKKLEISNWPGTNKSLIKLWSGLRALEQVTFESCTGLGNVAFVGEDVGDPVFLKLKSK